MKKVNVEATKLNNEDVITTSGSLHKGKYHLYVATPNAIETTKEACYLYSSESLQNPIYVDNTLQPPTEISSSGVVGFSSGYTTWKIDLGNPKSGDIFYWNGTKWVKCNETHSS